MLGVSFFVYARTHAIQPTTLSFHNQADALFDQSQRRQQTTTLERRVIRRLHAFQRARVRNQRRSKRKGDETRRVRRTNERTRDGVTTTTTDARHDPPTEHAGFFYP